MVILKPGLKGKEFKNIGFKGKLSKKTGYYLKMGEITPSTKIRIPFTSFEASPVCGKRIKFQPGAKIQIQLPRIQGKWKKRIFSLDFGAKISYKKAALYADVFGSKIKIYRIGTSYLMFPTTELVLEMQSKKGLRLGLTKTQALELFGFKVSGGIGTHLKNLKSRAITIIVTKGGTTLFGMLEKSKQGPMVLIDLSTSIGKRKKSK